MATVEVCDGCGEPLGEERHSFGIVKKVTACGSCVPKFTAYLADLDVIQEKVSADFIKRRERLIGKVSVELKNLPDTD